MSLAYVYFEEEPGPASGGKAAHTGRGAADRCEHRQAAEVVGQAAIIRLRFRRPRCLTDQSRKRRAKS
jgi:hypothetical protein